MPADREGWGRSQPTVFLSCVSVSDRKVRAVETSRKDQVPPNRPFIL